MRYPVDSWEYTKEGYLLFEGSHYSEIYYALSLSDEPEHTALRVLPLDETCRKLNRAYLLPVGYGGNNLFLVDWSEQNFENLNFYDLFTGSILIFMNCRFPLRPMMIQVPGPFTGYRQRCLNMSLRPISE